MARVDQIYCTHCLPRDAVFGEKYTVRAGSLDSPAQLKTLYFQVVSEFLRESGFYKPPRDMPAEKWPSGRAENMPARLVYIPAYRGYRVLGHVFYRTYDSSGTRVGSYFAHLLFQPAEADEPWDPRECIESWLAEGWKRRDTPDDQKSLDSFDDFSTARGCLLSGQLPRINRQVLHQFLTLDAGQVTNFADLDIQRFCRQTTSEQRQVQLAALMQGFLQLDHSNHESLLLVADPGVAALYFYGILTLLPAASIPPETSFSTYETRLDEALPTLVSTTFYSPERSDLTVGERERGAFWLNTFSNDHAAIDPSQQHAFPKLIVSTFVADPQTATTMLTRCQDLQVKSPGDLSRFVQIHQSALALLMPQAKDADNEFDTSPAQDYAAWFLYDQLVAKPMNEIQINQLAESPNIERIIRLLLHRTNAMSSPMADAINIAARFLPFLTSEVLSNLIDSPLPLDYRCKALHAFAEKKVTLPGWMEEALTASDSAALTELAPRSRPEVQLLEALVELSTPDLLSRIQPEVPPNTACALLRAILRSGAERRASRRALWLLLSGSGKVNHAIFDDPDALLVGCRAVAEQLLQASTLSEFSDSMRTSSNSLLVLSLLLQAGDEQTERFTVLELTDAWPEPLLSQLLEDPHLDLDFRADVLTRRIVQHNLPERLGRLLLHKPFWHDLRVHLFQRLDAATIVRLYVNERESGDDAFLSSLFRSIDVTVAGPSRESAAAKAFEQIRNLWSKDEFDQRVLKHGGLLVGCCLPKERLSDAQQRLQELASIQWRPARFSQTIDVLDHLVRTFSRQDSTRQRVADWKTLRDQLVRFGDQCHAIANQKGEADVRENVASLASPIAVVFAKVCNAYDLADYLDRKRRIAALVDVLLADQPSNLQAAAKDALQLITVYEGVRSKLSPPSSGPDFVVEHESYPGQNFPIILQRPRYLFASVSVTVDMRVKDRHKKNICSQTIPLETDRAEGVKYVWISQGGLKPAKGSTQYCLGFLPIQDFQNFTLECQWSFRCPYWSSELPTATISRNMNCLSRTKANRILLVDDAGYRQHAPEFLSKLLSPEEFYPPAVPKGPSK